MARFSTRFADKGIMKVYCMFIPARCNDYKELIALLTARAANASVTQDFCLYDVISLRFYPSMRPSSNELPVFPPPAHSSA